MEIMKVSKNFPTELVELIETVCKDYHRALPYKLLWSHKKRKSTSGYTSYSTKPYISIISGDEPWQYRTVVLHELAHHILSKRKPQGHTVKFWELVVELNEKYGDLEHMVKRELDLYEDDAYRMKARQVFADRLPKES